MSTEQGSEAPASSGAPPSAPPPSANGEAAKADRIMCSAELGHAA